MPKIEADPPRILRWRTALASRFLSRWWVAERDGSIVGLIGIRPSRDPIDPTLGEVDTIAVDPLHGAPGLEGPSCSLLFSGCALTATAPPYSGPL